MNFLEKEYQKLIENETIDANLYEQYNVKKGLRNANGTGVLVGLTRVSEVHGYNVIDNIKVNDEGHLYYRGIDIYDIVKIDKDCYGYEKTCFLLLFGHMPSKEELELFKEELSSQYDLPEKFLENIILQNPSHSLMNHIARAVLSLYSFDDEPDKTDGLSLLKKGVWMIAKMPAIVSYSYQAKTHYIDKDSLNIHFPKKEYSIAQNILYMSRNDGKFSDLEADTLDLALMIHADHGGGNNSAFTSVVVSSSNTDIYSCITAALGSLKGPRHGGANQAVLDMMDHIISDIGIKATDEEINNVLEKILSKNYFDNSGLIYGIGHAIYTNNDPRCVLLKAKVRELSKETNPDLFNFYDRFENLAIKALVSKKGGVACANVDYYSGLTYQFLNISRDLFIPIFACARLVGWISHIIEDRLYCNKIIRPATKFVGVYKEVEND